MKIEITKGWDGDAIAGLGEHDWKDAFDAVKKWAKTHVGYDDFMDAAWGFCRCQDGHCIVDFGSHTYFGRYMP
jgi:hypothetical protein